MHGDRRATRREIDAVEALLLLAHPGRGRGSGLDHEDSAGASYEVAGILAGSVVMVTGKQQIDPGFLDHIERKLLASDRPLRLAAHLEREERMVSNQNSQGFLGRAGERAA